MKENARESEKSQEAAERAARAERRRRRKERAASPPAPASGKKGPTRVARKSSENGGDKSPTDVQVDVPQPKKRKRMKTVVTQDNMLQMIYSDNPEDAKISLCDEHYDKLMDKLTLHGIAFMISKDEAELKAKVAAKKIDPLFHATEALIRLSLNTIGSEGTVQYRCPVCALNKFDFVSQIAHYMRQVCVKSTS
jgi:hypothetical protein